jgi:hypothetical protein
MTDYNDILDTEIDPGSPVATTLLVRLRDNPIAIAQGAAGAPTTQAAAVTLGSVHRAKFSTSLEKYRFTGVGCEFTGFDPINITWAWNVISITHVSAGQYELNLWLALSPGYYPMAISVELGAGNLMQQGAMKKGQPVNNTAVIPITTGTLFQFADVESVNFMAWSGVAAFD